MKVVITGAGGQLGSSLNQVPNLGNLEIINFTRAQLDITESGNVEEMMNSMKPDWVINTAAYTNVDGAESEPEKAFLVNAKGPENLAMSASRSGAKLIQISTDYVFDGTSTNAYGEEDPKNPKSIYGASKSSGEDNVISVMKFDYYILRTSWLYSEYKSNFAKFMTSKATNGREYVEVVNDQFGQPTYAGDLANQIFRIIELEPKYGVYHGTNSGRTNWFEFAQEIFQCVGADSGRVKAITSTQLQRRAKRPANSTLSHSQWGQNGMLEMRSWREALHESIPNILASVEKE